MFKKFMSVLLAVMLCVSLGVTAMAEVPASANVTDMVRSLETGFSGRTNLGHVSPQDRLVLHINLVDTMFEWEGHTPDASNPSPLTASQINRARMSVSSNSNRVLDDVRINLDQSRIEVVFQRGTTAVRDSDFVFEVTLSVNNREMRAQAITFTGTFGNEVLDGWNDSRREDISRGETFHVRENISSIQFTIGEGVRINTRLNRGDQVRATATSTPDDRAWRIMDRYRQINDVIIVDHSGFPSGATVTLPNEWRSYFVYDSNERFLGRGNERLPLTTRYFLASSRIPGDNSSGSSSNNDDWRDRPSSGGSSSQAPWVSGGPGSSIPTRPVDPETGVGRPPVQAQPPVNRPHTPPMTSLPTSPPANTNFNPNTGR